MKETLEKCHNLKEIKMVWGGYHREERALDAKIGILRETEMMMKSCKVRLRKIQMCADWFAFNSLSDSSYTHQIIEKKWMRRKGNGQWVLQKDLGQGNRVLSKDVVTIRLDM